MFKQKGLLILILFIVVKLLVNFYSFTNYDDTNIYKSQAYSNYIEKHKGKVTEEKQIDIDREYMLVNNANYDLQNATTKFREGSLSKEELDKIKNESYERINNSTPFYYMYNNYMYAKEKPEERYILEVNGWNELLSYRIPDFLMILCIIVIATTIFCMEFGNSMYSLLLSSVNGKYKVANVKIFMGIVIAIFVVLIFSIIDYGSAYLILGLENGNYPLQSLRYFENSQYSMSIFQGYMLSIACRLFAAIILVIIVNLISIITKESIITLFLSFILILIPFIIIAKSSILYYLPLPSGLFSATGFFRGDVYVSKLNSKMEAELIKEFTAISKEHFIILILLFAVLFILLFYFCLKEYSKLKLVDFKNEFSKKMVKRSKRFSCFIIIILITTNLLSCTNSDLKEDNFLYQKVGVELVENNEYLIKLEIESNSIIATNKLTGESINLNTDPFDSSEELNIKAIFVDEYNCYYIEQNNKSSGIIIYKINMTNFEKVAIYNSIPENNADFFGLTEKVVKEENKFRNPVTRFFVFDDYIYYEEGSNLIQINRKNGDINKVIRDIKGGLSIAFKNEYIYYIDNKYNLTIYNEATNEMEKISGIYSDDFIMEDDELKYKDLSDMKYYTYPMK